MAQVEVNEPSSFVSTVKFGKGQELMGIQMLFPDRLQEMNHCQQWHNWLSLTSRVSVVFQELLDIKAKKSDPTILCFWNYLRQWIKERAMEPLTRPNVSTATSFLTLKSHSISAWVKVRNPTQLKEGVVKSPYLSSLLLNLFHFGKGLKRSYLLWLPGSKVNTSTYAIKSWLLGYFMETLDLR